jgi:hypothetical protein
MNDLTCHISVRKLATVFMMMMLEENRRETSRIINTGVHFLMAYSIRGWTGHINWKLGGNKRKERRKEVISEEELGLRRQREDEATL